MIRQLLCGAALGLSLSLLVVTAPGARAAPDQSSLESGSLDAERARLEARDRTLKAQDNDIKNETAYLQGLDQQLRQQAAQLQARAAQLQQNASQLAGAGQQLQKEGANLLRRREELKGQLDQLKRQDGELIRESAAIESARARLNPRDRAAVARFNSWVLDDYNVRLGKLKQAFADYNARSKQLQQEERQLGSRYNDYQRAAEEYRSAMQQLRFSQADHQTGVADSNRRQAALEHRRDACNRERLKLADDWKDYNQRRSTASAKADPGAGGPGKGSPHVITIDTPKGQSDKYSSDGKPARPAAPATPPQTGKAGAPGGTPGAAGGKTSSGNVDSDKAAQYLKANSGTTSTGRCATSVRQALEAGGMDTTGHPRDAKDYGPFLTSRGFLELPAENYKPQKGDIVVLQPYAGGSPQGHVAMFNGSEWVSDFVQKDFWGGPGYRQKQPDYKFYRPPQ